MVGEGGVGVARLCLFYVKRGKGGDGPCGIPSRYIGLQQKCNDWLGVLQGSGQSIDFLTPATAFTRVVTGLPQILQGGRFFDKEGKRVEHKGERYQPNGVRIPF